MEEKKKFVDLKGTAHVATEGNPNTGDVAKKAIEVPENQEKKLNTIKKIIEEEGVMARGINEVTLLGWVGQDSELRSPNGTMNMLSFSLATSRSWKKKDSDEWETKTDWHSVVAFGKLAEAAVEIAKKGHELLVKGRIEYYKTEKDGVDRYYTSIVAHTIHLCGGKVKIEENPSSAQELPF